MPASHARPSTPTHANALTRTFRGSCAALVFATSLELTDHVPGGGPAAVQAPGTLTVVVEGARNGRGQLRVAVFDREEGFPNNQSMARRTTRVPMQTAGDSVQSLPMCARGWYGSSTASSPDISSSTWSCSSPTFMPNAMQSTSPEVPGTSLDVGDSH